MAIPFLQGETHREWQVPSYAATESRKLGWLAESCQEGISWAKSQRGYEDWGKAIDIISGTSQRGETLEYRSDLNGNRLKVNVQTSISGLAAIRPWCGYQGSGAYQKQALMLNQATRAFYLQGFWDQSIKRALQWSSVTGTGWIRPVYRRPLAGQCHGQIELDAFGMPSVLPVQMPDNGDYQRAYAVTLLDPKQVWEAHGMFPDFQDRLTPTDSKYWYSSGISKASQENSRNSSWNPFKAKGRPEVTDHLVPLRYTTINDLEVNISGKTIPMGEPGSSWYYEVPSFNSEIPAGNDFHGNPTFRKATALDARMYPFRRLIISSDSCVTYDGPAFNWHGRLDLIPFCLDRWPWEPMGFSMFHDGYKIAQAITQIDRGTMDKIIADMDRPMAYDMNAVSKREANQVDLMQPRQRIAFDGDAVDKPFQQIAPDEVYRVGAESLAFRKELQGDLDYVLQTRDIVEMGKARALKGNIDEIDALINANGPRVKDMSRGMEMGVCEIAEQTKYLTFQYIDTARLIPFIDESGATTVYDYDPASLVPSHMPGEKTDDGFGGVLASMSSRIQRARWMAQNLPFLQTPHSVHEIHQMTYRLMLMQMKDRGAPIPWCDIMEANDVPDVKRASGSTAQDRYYSEQETQLEQGVRAQAIAEGLGIDVNALMGGAKEGRPPTAQQAPQLQTKGDGRTVVSESG